MKPVVQNILAAQIKENPIRSDLCKTLIFDINSFKENENKTDTIEPIKNASGDIILTGGATNIIFYNQNDPRWANKLYGPNNTIGTYGCGPTVLATIISSLTTQKINPEETAKWAYDNGFFSSGSGSYHSIIPEGAKSFGLKVDNIKDYSAKNLIQELSTGKVIVVLMKKGHFTAGGHFIILRGVTLDGKVLIDDPKSLENSQVPWDIDIIINEAKYSASSGGPMWSIYN